MRNGFSEQLDKLNVELITMGALCEDAIDGAIAALQNAEERLVKRVFQIDGEIDQKERDIEALCMKLLLRQQPVARDLRAISSALKMISDMERIGDQASDIADITRYIGQDWKMGKLHMADMAAAAIKMVKGSVESFVKKDLGLARSIVLYDDVVDALFAKVKKELIDLIGEEAGNGECCMDLLMIAKYLERIGDHAVNIAEWVEFAITGEHFSDEHTYYEKNKEGMDQA